MQPVSATQLWAAVFAGAVALPAAAADAPSVATQARFELTPYAAYRFGGEFDAPSEDGAESRSFELRESSAQGLILDIRAGAVNTQWEILYAHQRTELETQPSFGAEQLDVDVDYLQFGGTYLFDDNGPSTVPFIAMTAGITRFAPRPAGIESETYFSGSIGGGVHLRADKRIGVRLEARAFGTLVESDSALFCRTGPEANACALSVEGTALFQWEARAGVVVRFLADATSAARRLRCPRRSKPTARRRPRRTACEPFDRRP